jgi:hypothetical protein
MIDRLSKKCTKCKAEKPIGAFYKKRSTRDGLHCSCRECSKASYKDNKVRCKKTAGERALKTRYGLTPETYAPLLQSQNNRCKCCGVEMAARNAKGSSKRAVIDHCHETGQTRAIISNTCNVAEGQIRDKQHLLSLARYLFGVDLTQQLLFGKN